MTLGGHQEIKDHLQRGINNVQTAFCHRKVSGCIAMRPTMITQMIQKQFFCVTDESAIGKLLP